MGLEVPSFILLKKQNLEIYWSWIESIDQVGGYKGQQFRALEP